MSGPNFEWSVAVAKNEGYDARINAKRAKDNPHRKGDTDLRAAWAEGWLIAEFYLAGRAQAPTR